MNSVLKDHRQIGQEQELFIVDEEVGPGLPLWLPKGATIRRELERYMTDLEISEGYLHVITPHVAKLDLYKKSGHWKHYKESMYPPMKKGTEKYELKPMNCPHHIQIFKSRPRSYRELPVRLAEFGTFYRFENSGELFGLMRVRGMTLNDAHIFCSMEQLKEEFIKVVRLVEQVYKDLNLKDFWYRLSLHDSKDKGKYGDKPELWEASEKAIKDALKKAKVEYKEVVGDAAFYGPKLDVQIPNALSKDETVSTIQIDFYQPENFNLEYVGEDGKKHPVVMIHRGIISTLERMVAFLTEQYQGVWPIWLAPTQVKIIPITARNNEYSQKVLAQLKSANIRLELDDRGETMQSKIRDATTQKIPYMLIVGDREEKEKRVSGRNSVAVRTRNGEDLGAIKVEEFLDKIKKEIESKA
ncbi:MAG: threonyl-tRNA synthetase [Microgenomates group bacterium Gr01-1014_7]|nr:MAG: threonyl-tRNA synthetase [Microgenomates group bacterium Gr01-1014_7]